MGKLDVAITDRRTRILWLQHLLIMSVRIVESGCTGGSQSLIDEDLRPWNLDLGPGFHESDYL